MLKYAGYVVLLDDYSWIRCIGFINIPPLKQWSTEISAHDPATGVLKVWCGPHVPGISQDDAQQYCNDHGLGYCKVSGQLVAEIPTKEDGITPDWPDATDYETISNN